MGRPEGYEMSPSDPGYADWAERENERDEWERKAAYADKCDPKQAERNPFANIDYSDIPPHMVEPAKAYVEEKVHPGGFLYSVLSNDLYQAVTRADAKNKEALDSWLGWLGRIPLRCWGSATKVMACLESGLEENKE